MENTKDKMFVMDGQETVMALRIDTIWLCGGRPKPLYPSEDPKTTQKDTRNKLKNHQTPKRHSKKKPCKIDSAVDGFERNRVASPLRASPIAKSLMPLPREEARLDPLLGMEDGDLQADFAVWMIFWSFLVFPKGLSGILGLLKEILNNMDR